MVEEVNSTELAQRLEGQSDRLLLIDVRTEQEVAQGIIPNSAHLPMHLIASQVAQLRNSDKEIVLYCRSGHRSLQACQFLHQQGIETITNLRGGILSWAHEGLPIGRPGA